MSDLLPQISGAVAGGLVGGFSGFVVNVVHERLGQARARHNVASALVGEIEGLCEHIKYSSIASGPQTENTSGVPAYTLFRGERDYNPIYRSMGVNFGLLPNPLPRRLVKWHVSLAVSLERAHEIHELSSARDPELATLLAAAAEHQRRAYAKLLGDAERLIADLSKL